MTFEDRVKSIIMKVLSDVLHESGVMDQAGKPKVTFLPITTNSDECEPVFIPTPPRGAKGKDGLDGNDGLDGADGLIGPQGPQGPQGDAGPEGSKGDQGVRGPRGVPLLVGCEQEPVILPSPRLPMVIKGGQDLWYELTRPATYSTLDGEFGFTFQGFAENTFARNVGLNGLVSTHDDVTYLIESDSIAKATESLYEILNSNPPTAKYFPDNYSEAVVNEQDKVLSTVDSNYWRTTFPNILAVIMREYQFDITRVYYNPKRNQIRYTRTSALVSGAKVRLVQNRVGFDRMNMVDCCSPAGDVHNDPAPTPEIVGGGTVIYGYWYSIWILHVTTTVHYPPPPVIVDGGDADTPDPVQPDPDDFIEPTPITNVLPPGEQITTGNTHGTTPGNYKQNEMRYTLHTDGNWYVLDSNLDYHSVPSGYNAHEFAQSIEGVSIRKETIKNKNTGQLMDLYVATTPMQDVNSTDIITEHMEWNGNTWHTYRSQYNLAIE